MNCVPDDPRTWPSYKPLIIAHDVGRSRDRSTAVVGGNSPCGRQLLGIEEAIELPLKLYGSARASALAVTDRKHHSNALLVADVSNDPTYAEVLFETFGRRVIGLHITRHGDGSTPEWRPVKGGYLPVYTIGRSFLFDLLHAELQADVVKFADSQTMRHAFEQLVNLQTEFRDTGVVYTCPPGHHDDLGISIAMLAWAARHQHLECWLRNLAAMRRPRRPRRDDGGWAAHT